MPRQLLVVRTRHDRRETFFGVVRHQCSSSCDMCLRQTCVRLFYLSLLAKYLSISIGQCNGHTSPRLYDRDYPHLSLCISRSFIFQSWAIHPAPETGTHVSSMVSLHSGAPTAGFSQRAARVILRKGVCTGGRGDGGGQPKTPVSLAQAVSLG